MKTGEIIEDELNNMCCNKKFNVTFIGVINGSEWFRCNHCKIEYDVEKKEED